jgi:hypothetical protein
MSGVSISGSVLVSRIIPLKRILCLCPFSVPGKDLTDPVEFKVGMAISDPYLSFASPVQMEMEPLYHHLRDDKKLVTSLMRNNLPTSGEEFLRQLGFRDVGGVAIAFPMKQDLAASMVHDAQLQYAREALAEIIGKYDTDVNNSLGPFKLQCFIDDRLTITEVKTMANEEPEMWEEIIDVDGETLAPNEASMHAAVALNSFLWQHTGGWRNTFA